MTNLIKLKNKLNYELNKSRKKYNKLIDDTFNSPCIFDKSDIEHKKIETIKEILNDIEKLINEQTKIFNNTDSLKILLNNLPEDVKIKINSVMDENGNSIPVDISEFHYDKNTNEVYITPMIVSVPELDENDFENI